MAHNLYYNEQKGEHSFFSVQQKAWHGLGKIVQGYPTTREAIEFAGLDRTTAYNIDYSLSSGTGYIVAN